MKTRRYRNYYARRRAPHSLSSFYPRAKLIPLGNGISPHGYPQPAAHAI